VSLDHATLEIVCPVCRSMTIYYKDKDFWKCPICETEVWPPLEKKKITYYEAKWLLSELSVQCWPPIPYQITGGGSNKSGKKRNTEKIKGLRRYLYHET
jgi:hypothetical protein